MDDSVHAARDALRQRFQALATQLGVCSGYVFMS